jgi:DnaJ-class molecular chaperone
MLKLGRAYETLKDEDKRRAYDLIYPQITKTRSTSSQQTRPKPGPVPSTTKSKEEQDEAKDVAALAAISKSRQERASRWANTHKFYDDAIFELNREVRQLQNAIRKLDSIGKAE